MNDTNRLTNLKSGDLVLYKGILHKIAHRHLNPNKKPGLGRVSYDICKAFVKSDYTHNFTVFKAVRVAASKLTIVDDSKLSEILTSAREAQVIRAVNEDRAENRLLTLRVRLDKLPS